MPLSTTDDFCRALRDVLSKSFNLEINSVAPLSGEYSESFRLTTVNEDYVAKVGQGSEARALREMQTSFAAHLRSRNSELPLATPVNAQNGSFISDFDLAGEAYFATVDTWTTGSLISEMDFRGGAFLRELGENVAELVIAGSDFDDSRAERTHEWDLRRYDELIEPLLGSLSDQQHSELVRKLLTEFRESIGPRLSLLPTQVLHHDLNDFNIVAELDENYSWRVEGFIDFGDVLRSARVCELAIAGAYAMLREPDPLRALGAVVEGFTSRCALSEEEADLVFPLSLLRLSMNASTWNHRIATQGSSPYAVARSQMTWPVLTQLAELDRAMVTDFIRLSANLPVRTRSIPLTPVDFVDLDSTTFEVSPQFSAPSSQQSLRQTASGEARTIQLGLGLGHESEFLVRAPFSGEFTAGPDDTLNLRGDNGVWCQIEGVSGIAGKRVEGGEEIGRSSDIRIVLSLTPIVNRLPAFIAPWEIPMWEVRCPDPLSLLEMHVEPREASGAQVTRLRQQVLASSQRAYYKQPMNLVGSTGVWFNDELGRRYLDAVNNVTHVGHANSHVVEAAYRQMKSLNTNSRFTYSALATYAERLVATLPDPLEVVFFTCTGSESNDLALRIARQVTGRKDVFVLGGAYHGNTAAVMDISPNRYRGAGGSGKPEFTQEFEQPNLYRGSYQYGHENPGAGYAADAIALIDGLVTQGRPPAAFFAESLMGTAGQVMLPEGYLAKVFNHVRSAGGLCVSDEVQVGLGRLGTHFWGFETHGVIPDIVTMGKPMGNGHPLSAVVTTREIADAFDNGMKYFNTFAGSPVSCAIGHAVLDVLFEENLQENALRVGDYFVKELKSLQASHESIGDIRGVGLYVGIELVADRETKNPDRALAYRVSERMRDEGVITYPNGMGDNILKIKPPMIFSKDNVDLFVSTLGRVLSEVKR